MPNLSDLLAADAVQSPSSDWITALSQLSDDAGFCEGSPFADSHAPRHFSSGSDAQGQAFERGFAEGCAEGERKAMQGIETERAQLQNLRLSFRTLDQVARETLAAELEATVRSLCEQVMSDYAIDPGALAQRCLRAAKRLSGGPRELTLHLHPETSAALSPDALPGWTILEDASLAKGAITITGPDGTVRDEPQDWARAIAEALRG